MILAWENNHPQTNIWFVILPLLVGSIIVLFPFLNFWLNSGTNRPVLGPKKTATISATAIGPLWSDGAIHGADQQGSWGTSRLRMVTGYRPSMVTLRDSLFALSLNQCHHCPEKIDKTWHNTSFLAEQILERRYSWAQPIASLPNQGFSNKPKEISPTDTRKLMRSSGTRSYCSTVLTSLL